MNAGHLQIGDWLGAESPATETEILRIVEGRLAPSVIKRLVALGLERAEIDESVIPLRTLQHRRSRREKLTLGETDRVVRIVRVLSFAEFVYGSRERALAWLRTSHPRLQGRSPLSLVKTDTGSRIVEELLIQIDELRGLSWKYPRSTRLVCQRVGRRDSRSREGWAPGGYEKKKGYFSGFRARLFHKQPTSSSTPFILMRAGSRLAFLRG